MGGDIMSSFFQRCFKKVNNRTKKEGSVIIFSLFIMIIIFVLAAILFLFINMFGVMEKADNAVETVAKTRAQAVDIPLKEEYGYIEIMNGGYGDKYHSILEDDIFNELEDARSNTPSPGYDFAVVEKSNNKYKGALSFAENTAIVSGISQLENHQFPNSSSRDDLPFSELKEENFCVEVFPLPEGNAEVANSNESDIKLGCEVDLEGEKINVFPENIEIKGRDNTLNNPYDNENNNTENERLQVVNAVFVGFAYEDTNNAFYRTFKNLTKNTGIELNPPVRVVYKIAYPQIDAHSFGSGDNW